MQTRPNNVEVLSEWVVSLPPAGAKRSTNCPHTRCRCIIFIMRCSCAGMYEYRHWTEPVCVCVCGSVGDGGLCLWLLSLTGLGRRSVISPSHRHTVLLLRLTSESPSVPFLLLSSSPWLSLSSSPPTSPSLIPWAFQCSCVSHAGCVWMAAAVWPATQPLASLPKILFYPFALQSFLSGLLLTFVPPPPHHPPTPWLHSTAQVCLACRRLLRPGASKGQGAQRQETHPHWQTPSTPDPERLQQPPQQRPQRQVQGQPSITHLQTSASHPHSHSAPENGSCNLCLFWTQIAHLLSGVKCHTYGSKHLPLDLH